ncbi:MAG: GGDEF domain-containing protein [Lachnospiraceae bacterium]|nr:GGDEF domain-containing protein [Lachnospiraceae bacterium]
MNIAVLIGGLLYDSQKNLMNGIMDCAEKKGVNIFVFTCGGDIYASNDHSKGEFQIYNLPDFSVYDGVIVVPNTIQNVEVVKSLENRLSGLKIPVIAIDKRMCNITSFEVDNEQAIYGMAEHVVEVHHKSKLLYISGPKENQESNERLAGFVKCMNAHQLEEGTHYRIMYGDFWMESGKRVLRRFLQEEGMSPEAVICANDYMAIGVVEQLKNEGMHVPEDVIVAGFDNSYEGRYHVPRITSIQKPMYDIGYEACRKLVEGGKQKQNYSFEVSYKFSESCGCSTKKEENIREFKRQMAKEKSDNIRWAEIINSMSADLNELNTLEEFIDKLKQYIKKMNFPFFYLCLCNEENLLGEIRLVDGVYQMPDVSCQDYAEEMRMVIGYENGIFLKPEKINTKYLLPKHFFEKQNGIISVVLPIHYCLHNMGYCVVGNSTFPMETIQFQTWIMNLGNGLENIRKHMLMQSMVEQLNRMWIYDTMTGVLNRAGFYAKAEGMLRCCREKKVPVLLLFLDIDGLKNVNDTCGHQEGDFYIKSVAKCCQKYCGKNGIVMRYGGDEFAILQRYEQGDSWQKIIYELKKDIRDIGVTAKKEYNMDASIGHYVAAIDENFKLETFLEWADREMYLMKNNKKQEEMED